MHIKLTPPESVKSRWRQETATLLKAGGLAGFRHNDLTCPIQATWIMLVKLIGTAPQKIERTGHEKL